MFVKLINLDNQNPKYLIPISPILLFIFIKNKIFFIFFK